MQSLRQHRSKQETTGIESGDHVDFGVVGEDVVGEVGDDGFDGQWVLWKGGSVWVRERLDWDEGASKVPGRSA